MSEQAHEHTMHSSHISNKGIYTAAGIIAFSIVVLYPLSQMAVIIISESMRVQ